MPRFKLPESMHTLGRVRKRKKRKKNIEDTVDEAQLVLTALRDSSDFCPPLKSVVGGLCKILEIIQVCILISPI